MNQSNRDESALDDAIAAVMSEPLDESAVARVEKRAALIETADPEPTPTLELRSNVNSEFRWLRLGGVSASIAASFVLVAWLAYYSATPSFAQVVEHVMQVRSVRFASKMQVHNDAPRNGEIMIQGDVIRFEHGPENHQLISLMNTETKEALFLDTGRKLAQERSASNHADMNLVNPIAELIAAKDKSVKSLGSDRLGGRLVDVFRIKGSQFLGLGLETEMTLWVDSETQLPTKIEVQETDPKFKSILTFDDFQWNTDLPEDLFAMAIPTGFKTGDIVIGLDGNDLKPDAPNYSQDVAAGVLFSGRVPSRIEVDRERGVLTALIREPETNQSVTQLPIELRQWDLSTGELRWKKPVGGAGELAICESKGLAAVVQGQEVQIRMLSTGEIIKTWESGHVLGAVAFNRDGTRLAHGYILWSDPPTGGVEIWNVETGKLEHHIKDLTRVDAIQFSPTSELLVVSSSGSTQLFNAENGELEYSFTSGSRAGFHPDGKLLAMISAEPAPKKTQGRVDLIDIESKQLVRSFVTSAGTANSWLLSLAFSPDGTQLAAGDWNGTLSVWNTASGESVHGLQPLPHGVHSVRFTKSNEIATGCEDGTLRLHALAK